MEKKQSSVEWLISQMQKSKDFHRVLNEVSQMSTAKIDIIEQAKAMHQKEITDAYVYGCAYQIDIKNGLSPIFYYNDRFGGDK